MTINIFWFRRDLRLSDNVGLNAALHSGLPVLPIFIFDKDILRLFSNPANAQVSFIYKYVDQLNSKIQQANSTLLTFHTNPIQAFTQLLEHYTVANVFTNSDYEQSAINRDQAVCSFLQQKGVGFKSYKDQVIFEKNEICKPDKTPYTIFTPYSKRWLLQLSKSDLQEHDSSAVLHHLLKHKPVQLPSLQQLGYIQSSVCFPPLTINRNLICDYGSKRDYPAEEGTSRLGVHLRFGTISIRELMRQTQGLSSVFLNELIWREFYQSITWNFPRLAESKAFKPAYDNLEWRNNELEFEAWCSGQTGYPIVDAGIRQLLATGFMHNRVRMIVASFLVKHLLIDWRWGEVFFANHLLDFDFAANNGGWQWAASSGCDAAPYFRVFNPSLQTTKFDPQLKYIRQWVPEFESLSYPKAIIDHSYARQRVLASYAKAVGKKNID